MGRSLALGMDALSSNRKLDAEFESQLSSLVRDAEKNGNDRENKHAKAVSYYANGQMSKACDEWEKILKEHPTDLQAVKFAHDAYFFMGNSVGKLSSIENVIEKWSPTIPCFSYLHGMHAFALEELERYAKAEKAAQKVD
jgi:tetratricopeptide (TPR) repeat protein